jgi:hypothetical protein
MPHQPSDLDGLGRRRLGVFPWPASQARPQRGGVEASWHWITLGAFQFTLGQ